MLDRMTMTRVGAAGAIAGAAAWLYAKARKRTPPRWAQWAVIAGLALLLLATRPAGDIEVEIWTLKSIDEGGLSGVMAGLLAPLMGGVPAVQDRIRAHLRAAAPVLDPGFEEDAPDAARPPAPELTPEVMPATDYLRPLPTFIPPGSVFYMPNQMQEVVDPRDVPAGLTIRQIDPSLAGKTWGAPAGRTYYDTDSMTPEEVARVRRMAEQLAAAEAQLEAVAAAAAAAAAAPPPSPQKVPVLDAPPGVKSAAPLFRPGMTEDQKYMAATLADPRFRGQTPAQSR